MRAWAIRHRLVIVAAALVAVFLTGVFGVTFRVYDERQARIDALAERDEALAEVTAELQRIAAENRALITGIQADRAMRLRARCEQDHRVAEALRAMVTAAIAPDRRDTPEARAFFKRVLPTIDAIDCTEGE